MARTYIRYEVRDRVAFITMDRPDVLNALHPPASREMRGAFTEFRDDPDALVAIVTGAGGRAFCSGIDLKHHAQNIRPGEVYPEADSVPFGGITSGFECWKPIIAAVEGYAVGGGLELAMACDVIVAAESAMLGLPEPRVGVVSTAGGAHRMSRQAPTKIAMGLLLTGRRFTAAEGHRWGLVNEVVPDGEALAAGGAVGGRDDRVRPALPEGHEADGGRGRGHAARRSHRDTLPGAGARRDLGRLRRGTARVRREAQAGLEGTLTQRRSAV